MSESLIKKLNAISHGNLSDPMVVRMTDWNDALAEVRAVLDESERQKERIEELETMVKVFRGCIETGVMPNQGSRCHKIIYDLVGESDDA